MTLDLIGPVWMRCGRAVRILCINRGGDRPIVGLVFAGRVWNGKHYSPLEDIVSWKKNGCYGDNEEYDLVNCPDSEKRYALFYKDNKAVIAYSDGTPEKDRILHTLE